jgi:hypothetical protein
VIVENPPSLYIRFFHGRNLWDATHIMGRFASPVLKGVWEMSKREQGILRKVLPQYISAWEPI